MEIREVMTPSAELIDANAMIKDAAIKMRDQDLGALPVGDQGRLIGMVTDRDIVIRAVAADRGAGTTPIREVVSEGLVTCYEDASIEEAAVLMAEHQLRRLPVINRSDELVGVVSLADLAQSTEEGADLAQEALTDVTEPTPDAPRA